MSIDCLVIGSGPGGYAAAFRASDLGMKVMLIEKYPELGGVCLNVGCIPSKALLHVSELINAHKDYEVFGLECDQPVVNKKKLLDFKENLIKKLTGGLSMLAKKRKVEVIQGEAKFCKPDAVEVIGADGKSQEIKFKQCIIATGSRPIQLDFLPDNPRIIDSTGALELPVTKGKMLIIGGGIIGCEMATVYQAMGMQVTICEMLDQIMPGADIDLVQPCHKQLQSEGIEIITQAKVKDVATQKKQLKVTIEKPDGAEESIAYDLILQAVGRVPNADKLNLEACGVQTDDRGFIQINPKSLKTTNDKILAIGDIVGGAMLAHKAAAQGKVAAEIVAGKKVIYDVKVIPSVAYTNPEVAWVGLTELEAKREGVAFEKGVFPWAANGRSLCMGRQEGLTKLIFDPNTKRILGAGICGEHAGDLITELTLAIEMGCRVEDVALTVHPHPTLSETVGQAAEVSEKTVVDLYLAK